MAKKAIQKEDELVLCSFLDEKVEQEKKKVVSPMISSLKLCMHSYFLLYKRQVWHVPFMDSSYTFTKNSWIGDLDALCHITNNEPGLYDVTKID